jgi:hypothetical protein
VRRGALKRTRSSSAANSSSIARISEQWKGAETFSATARSAPAASARRAASSTAGRCPEITLWPGSL